MANPASAAAVRSERCSDGWRWCRERGDALPGTLADYERWLKAGERGQEILQ